MCTEKWGSFLFLSFFFLSFPFPPIFFFVPFFSFLFSSFFRFFFPFLQSGGGGETRRLCPTISQPSTGRSPSSRIHMRPVLFSHVSRLAPAACGAQRRIQTGRGGV